MPGSAATAPDPLVKAQRRRAVVASTVGTTIEWYDFFLYGTMAALVFPQGVLPGRSAYSGILASFAVQFVGFAARPIGAAIFGHFGDRIGRKATARDDADADGHRDVPDGPAARPRADRGSPRRSCWWSCGSCRASASAASGAARCCCRWSGAPSAGAGSTPAGRSWACRSACCCPPASCQAGGRATPPRPTSTAGAGGSRSCSASCSSASGCTCGCGCWRARPSPRSRSSEAVDKQPVWRSSRPSRARSSRRPSSGCRSRRRSTCSSPSC